MTIPMLIWPHTTQVGPKHSRAKKVLTARIAACPSRPSTFGIPGDAGHGGGNRWSIARSRGMFSRVATYFFSWCHPALPITFVHSNANPHLKLVVGFYGREWTKGLIKQLNVQVIAGYCKWESQQNEHFSTIALPSIWKIDQKNRRKTNTCPLIWEENDEKKKNSGRNDRNL